MKIVANKLDGVKFLKTTHTSGNIKQMSFIVAHDDEGASMAGTESWIMNPVSKVSYHVLIGKNGDVTQFVPFDKRAYHAGVSEWKGLNDLNWYSIGVCMQNRNKEPYTEVQINKFIEVCKVIADHYDIKEMVGHRDIAPTRKTDPHNGFPWERIRKGVFGVEEKSKSNVVSKTTTTRVNLRDGAGVNYSILETLDKSVEVFVLSEKKDWTEVLVCGLKLRGWMSSQYLK